jgi:trimethylamine:corrinoid methyltransferase-like protein
LTLDINSTEAIIYLTERSLPCYATVAPNAGMTAPMTLLGTLALGNAEFLAAAILKQMVKPQSPNIYAALSTVADMRTGNYAPGAIETGILQMAHSQMAYYYNVPSGGYIGLSGAHGNDAQAYRFERCPRQRRPGGLRNRHEYYRRHARPHPHVQYGGAAEQPCSAAPTCSIRGGC